MNERGYIYKKKERKILKIEELKEWVNGLVDKRCQGWPQRGCKEDPLPENLCAYDH